MASGDPFRVDIVHVSPSGLLATLVPSVIERRCFQRHVFADNHFNVYSRVTPQAIIMSMNNSGQQPIWVKPISVETVMAAAQCRPVANPLKN